MKKLIIAAQKNGGHMFKKMILLLSLTLLLSTKSYAGWGIEEVKAGGFTIANSTTPTITAGLYASGQSNVELLWSPSPNFTKKNELEVLVMFNAIEDVLAAPQLFEDP